MMMSAGRARHRGLIIIIIVIIITPSFPVVYSIKTLLGSFAPSLEQPLP